MYQQWSHHSLVPKHWYTFSVYFGGLLTHWGRVTHKCVSKLTIIGPDNYLNQCWNIVNSNLRNKLQWNLIVMTLLKQIFFIQNLTNYMYSTLSAICNNSCSFLYNSFISGSHKGTGFKPMKWKVPETQTLYQICACKYTKSPPFCDGTHSMLPIEVTERQKTCPKQEACHKDSTKLCTGCGWVPDF